MGIYEWLKEVEKIFSPVIGTLGIPEDRIEQMEERHKQ